MGGGAGKPISKEVHLDYDPSHSNIKSDVTNTKVIKDPTQCDAPTNTVVSDWKLDLNRNRRVEISCKGGGVIRIGLTSTDPSENKNILQGSIFEKEEGFSPRKTTRILYKSDFNYIRYGPRDAEREYVSKREEANLWLYVIYVYGIPEIKAKLVGKDANETKDIRLSPLVGNLDSLNSNTAVCKFRERVLNGEVYHCHWDMILYNENIAGRQPDHGYMRLKLVSRNKRKEEVTIWERSSAVKAYPFSSVIAFCLSVNEKSVSHNLFVNSVGRTKKDHFTENIQPDNLYIVIEFSCGQIHITHARRGRVIQQDPGSILLVKNYKSDEEDFYDLLLEISGKIVHRPRRLQFGDSPGIFVLEFNERLTGRDIKNVKEALGCQVEGVEETDTVQIILEKVDELDDNEIEFEIDQYFSREGAGGGIIIGKEKDKDIPGCWIIQYKEKEIARNIWMTKTHNFTIEDARVNAIAFPVFEGLGLAVNNGKKPIYDTSPLEVEVDKEKLRFVLNRESEKMAFTDTITKRIKVKVIWATFNNMPDNDEFESEFEDGNNSEDGEEEPRSITFECGVPYSEGKLLAVWKDITRKSVLDYFSRSIHVVKFQVKNCDLADVLDVLQLLKSRHEFEYDENRESNQIRLFGSNDDVLKEVADKAGTPVVLQENVTVQVNVKLQKYLALDAEGLLDDVKKDCAYTSFKVDRRKEVVSLKGPKDEVQSGNVRILTLAIDVNVCQIPLQENQVEYLKRGGQELLKIKLREQKMNYNFTVADGSLDVMIYTGNNINIQERQKDMLAVIQNLIQSCVVPIDTDSIPLLETYEWKRFKKEIVARANEVLVLSEDRNKYVINITGAKETIQFAKEEIENFFKCNGVGKFMFRVPIEIAEYLDEFRKKEYQDNLECVKDSNSCHTGELSIHGPSQEIERLKEAIESDSKQIKIHWFHIEKTWIASVIQDLVDLKTLSHNEKFLLQVDIGHTFAVKGVTGVAVYKRNGTVIQVRQGNITFETTNVIVNNTDGQEKSFDRGIGGCFVDIGGEEIKDELFKEIQNRKKTLIEKIREIQKPVELDDKDEDVSASQETFQMTTQKQNIGFKVGEVIVTTSGRLRCIKVMHAFCPQWVDGRKSEEKEMKRLITKILQLCQEKGMTSVAIPAIGCGAEGYPEDKAASWIVEAVKEFIEHTKGVAIKEVILCDSSKTAVDNFTNALNTLKDQWFVFKHGRKIQVEDMNASQLRNAGSQIVFRPDSRNTPRKELKWGKQHQQAQATHGVQNETENQISGVGDEFKGGLPYNISITEKLTLHVKKGDLTKQMVNVIVNTTAEFPDLKGEVANAVIKAGGGDILKECKSHGSINVGEFKATGSGRLNCDEIYHALIPKKWNSETGQDFVHALVSSCLREAINRGYTSVAFPTIGTGKTGFPPDKVANSIVKAVCETGNTFKKSSLTDVTIVVYALAEGVCKVFEEVVPLLFKDTAADRRSGGQGCNGDAARVHPKRKTAKYVPPTSFEKHTHVDDVVIVKIVSTTDGKAIQKKLERIVEEQFVTKTLNFQELSKELTLTEPEESALKTLQMKHGIKVEIDKKSKCVKLTGLKKRVENCEFEAVKLLEYDFPIWRLKERNIRTVAASVRWHYSDASGKTNPVDDESNYEIHINYLGGQDFTYNNTAEKKRYKMIIGDMSEHPIDDPSKRRNLYLRTNIDSDIRLPHNWSITEKGGDVAEIQLNDKDAEFNEVKNMLIKDGCPARQIENIIRLENRFMWLQYQTKKRQLEKQNPRTKNERLLWHGTNIDTVPKIIKNGYDRNFAGNANMTAHGKGVYFASSSGYSNQDQYASRDVNGVKRMFLNRVLTGELCRGNSNMATLPLRPGVLFDNFQLYYDSAVDDVNNPRIFVIFHDTQAYPEYLIEYK